MCQPNVCVHSCSPPDSSFCDQLYMCICASHVFVGLRILVLRPAIHVEACFDQRLLEWLPVCFVNFQCCSRHPKDKPAYLKKRWN